MAMDDNRPLAMRLHIDPPLLFGLALLAALGLVVLYSAGGQSESFMIRQLIRLGIAFATMLVVAQISPSHLFRFAPWLYAVGLLMLVAVIFFGDVGKGAQRWLAVGGFRFQPSEMVKVTVPMMVAFYLCERALPPHTGRVITAAFLIALPGFLIARQPDLGTALLVASAGLFVLFLSGMRWRLILFTAVGAAASLPVLWHFMRDYQRQRVLTLLDPEVDPLGAGYHIIQSKIAIGSGGVYGKGWLNGTQSQLDFLPERSTDFVFAVLSEEFGLFGVAVLLAVYVFVILRGLYIASMAQNAFGRLLAGSLVLTFFVYVFVNIGMVSGMLPVVGLPLPLISFGGTSLVTVLASFGILMSVHTHRRFLSD